MNTNNPNAALGRPALTSKLIFHESVSSTDQEDIGYEIDLSMDNRSPVYQFARGSWVGRAPDGTKSTVAVVTKGWHGSMTHRANEWFTVKLYFEGFDGRRVRYGSSHVHRDGTQYRTDGGRDIWRWRFDAESGLEIAEQYTSGWKTSTFPGPAPPPIDHNRE